MRKLFSLLAMMVVTITAMSQTGTLQNADFSEGKVTDASIGSDGMKEVPSWRISSANGKYRAGAVVAYGSTSFVDYAAPAAGPEGSNGQGLAVLAAWMNTTQYVQDVTLPAGKYKMTVPVYNTAGNSEFAKNLIGVKYGETEKYATTRMYPVGQWTVENVEFELTEETSVTVSLGYEGANTGNSPSQHLFIDCVKLEAPAAGPVVAIEEGEGTYTVTSTSADAALYYICKPYSYLDEGKTPESVLQEDIEALADMISSEAEWELYEHFGLEPAPKTFTIADYAGKFSGEECFLIAANVGWDGEKIAVISNVEKVNFTPGAPAPEVTVNPSFFSGEEEIALSAESEVSVESANAIKVNFGESADVVKYATYVISTQEEEIAAGNLILNSMGYAEFAETLFFKAGTKYNLKIKAWDSEEIYTPELTIKDPVATFTCDFIGAYEEKNDLDFTDKVVKEVKANTSNIEEGKWYTWSNPRKANNQYAAPTPFYDQGEGKKPVREAAGQTVRTVLSQNTPVSDVTKYLVRFVKSGTGEAYHIQFATGNYVKNDLTTSATAEEAGLFMVYAATNSKADAAGEPYTEAGVGINITEDGVAYGKRLDGNGAGAELVTWGSNKIETADANNVWFFEEVEMAEPTTETYTVHITGAPAETKVTFGEQEYGNDETFDAKGFSLSQLTVPDHENYVKSVELDGTDIYVTYTYAKKVADISEINNEHAYVLICERGQLTTNEGELAPTAEKSYTESKSVFAFVKYNENFYLWSTAEEGFVFNDKSIAAEGEFQNVVLNAQEDGTFVLYIADTNHYINIDGATNLFIDNWDTADAGNKYSIYEVETFDATDALVLLENFTTGLNAVATPTAPAAIYSLTGQRQQRLQKGINIVRRQKVIK